MKKNISKFDKGDKFFTYDKTLYEVLDFTYETYKKKHYVKSSTCLNTETQKEVIISWNNSNNFEEYKP
jgi:hypothetical protein